MFTTQSNLSQFFCYNSITLIKLIKLPAQYWNTICKSVCFEHDDVSDVARTSAV